MKTGKQEIESKRGKVKYKHTDGWFALLYSLAYSTAEDINLSNIVTNPFVKATKNKFFQALSVLITDISFDSENKK